MRMTIALVIVPVLAGCSTAATTTVPPTSLPVAGFTSLPLATAVPSSASTSPVTAASPSLPVAGLKQVHDPGHVTGTLTGPCHARGQLPDPRCTPGAVDPAVTQADIGSTICRSGYTATVRPPASETDAFKFDVAYIAYGIPRNTVSELDHEVPLELGGSNDAANLWPEVGRVPNAKDPVELALNRAVCSGKVTLVAAQDAIAADWVSAERVLGLAGG